MKKHIYLLISSLFLSLSTWAEIVKTGEAALSQMNPYTFQMSCTFSDNGAVTFSYSLNANADSIDILVDKDNNGSYETIVYTITDATKLTRSSEDEQPSKHSVTVALSDLKEKIGAGTFKWAMRANRAAYSEVTHAYPNNWGRMVYNMPKGLVIDNNPESKYFGNIYTTESKTCTSADKVGNTLAGGTKTNYAKGEGVYAYYPTLDQYKYPTNHTCYTGGVTWGTTNDEYAPFRLAVASNGMVFVNDNRKSGDGVTASIYRINPAKLSTNLTFDKILYPGGMSKCSVDGHPRAISMAVINDNGTQKLYVLNAYRRSSVDGSYAYYPHMHRWTLNGTSIGNQEKEWVMCKNPTDKKESEIKYNGKNYEIVNQTTTMVPGIYNDLWIAQRRVSPDHNACLLHLKINGDELICDFVIVVNAAGKESVNKDLLKINEQGACPKAALALSADGSMLALGSNGYINVLDITYDPETKTPTLVRNDNKTIQLSTTAGDAVICNALAFDKANNLYAMSETTHQFYIYALPGQTSTTVPAQKSSTITITDNICWHPYPDSYQMTNAELLEIFKHDYKAKYGKDPEFGNNSVSDNFMWMLTNESSSWKWLGDYFKTIGVQRRKIPTNEELWGTKKDSNGKSTDGIKGAFNTWCSKNNVTKRSDQVIGEAATFFAVSANAYSFITNNTYKYKWLYDYILEVAKGQNVTLSSSSSWIWILHGFFNKDNKTSKTSGGTYTHNINFSSAGKPSEWRGAYLAAMKAQGIDVAIVDDAIDLNSEWRVCAATFFGQMGTEISQGFITTKINNKRNASDEWYPKWRASLPTTAKVKDNKTMPYVVRTGYLFAGWYFGNDHNGGFPGYNIETPATVDNIANACIYARWLEPTLHEGIVTDEQMIEGQQDIYNNFNLDLINLVAGQNYALNIDRKLVGGMYNTMCLPFAIAGKNEFATIKYADGSGKPFGSVNDFSLVKYTGSSPEEDALVLNFQELGNTEELPANTPFLLKPNNDITKLLQYGTAKTIVPYEHASVQIVDGDDDEEGGEIVVQTPAEYASTIDDHSISYTGVLAPVSVPQNSVLLVADNRLAVNPVGGEMMGMRGFFTHKAQAIQQPMALRITSKDNTTTYLDAIDMSTQSKTVSKILYNGQIYILRDGKVYTITGTRVK